MRVVFERVYLFFYLGIFVWEFIFSCNVDKKGSVYIDISDEKESLRFGGRRFGLSFSFVVFISYSTFLRVSFIIWKWL